jgi:[protein-PII] uridylyltransferase
VNERAPQGLAGPAAVADDCTPRAVRDELRAARERLKADYLARPNAQRYLRDHARLIDRALARLWRGARLPGSLALGAVGGYGRAEQFPGSDVDVLVLLPDTADAALQARLEAFVGVLWDIGLELGHAVRTVVECAEESERDVTIATTLLESRLIAGSRATFARLQREVVARIEPQAFFNAKRLEQEQRYTKYQDSPYSLEPNLKESPGGLRDLHVIRWIAQASGLGRKWADLAARGFVTEEEARQLRRVENFLADARIRLHFLAGRREDRILFDYQTALATQYGFAGDGAKRASEQFMQGYYRVAKSVTQLNQIVLQNLAVAVFPERPATPQPIDERFQIVHELLDAIDPLVFEREPAAILDSFLLLQRRTELKGMTAPTLRSLWRARKRIDARFRRDRCNRARFLAILREPRGIVSELRLMNQYGILGRVIPAFGKIVGQMQHDLFHVYTVDQHILQVVRNLRRFTMLEFAHEYPLCSRLIAGFERHWLLYVAAIFHDIAKGRGGDHSQLGAEDAARFCREHAIAGEDAALVTFLVRHHLTMSTVAQKQDLADPDVIRAFADTVKTERRLVALYLLTVADVRGTSPKVWNAWKGKLLEDLYRATLRLMQHGSPGLEQDVEHKQAEATRLLRLYALSDSVRDALWRELDLPYFLRHDPQEIAWQTRTLHYRVNTDQPVVKARLSPIGEGVQVMIYARDRKELFARICGYFESIQFTIVDAKIHTTRHGYALDTFLVLGTGNQAHYRDMLALIEYDLTERLANPQPLPPPARGRISRQLKHFPIQPEVHIRPDDKGTYHLLAVTAGDRPGLLYSIARVLGRYDVNLHTAKIVTLGERAEDVFVLSGDALNRPKSVLALETDLLEALA